MDWASLDLSENAHPPRKMGQGISLRLASRTPLPTPELNVSRIRRQLAEGVWTGRVVGEWPVGSSDHGVKRGRTIVVPYCSRMGAARQG